MHPSTHWGMLVSYSSEPEPQLPVQCRGSVPQAPDGRSGRKRLWLGCALLGALVLAAVTFALRVDIPGVSTVENWLPASGYARWFAGAALLSVALVFPTPRSALSLLAGAVFGLPQGLPLVLVGGLIGALAGFGLSRRLGRAQVVRLAGERLDRVDGLFRRHGVVAVLTARMMPAPPFAIVSYAAGLSRVGVVPFSVGTAVGMVPGSVAYVSIGASVMGADAWAEWLADPFILALSAALIALAAAAWWIRRPSNPSRPGQPRQASGPHVGRRRRPTEMGTGRPQGATELRGARAPE
jgi:uncharacterized membrane protein YdjX (TVP38/TMEM64 family)